MMIRVHTLSLLSAFAFMYVVHLRGVSFVLTLALHALFWPFVFRLLHLYA